MHEARARVATCAREEHGTLNVSDIRIHAAGAHELAAVLRQW